MNFSMGLRSAAGARSFPDVVLRGVAHTYRSALTQPVGALARTDLTIDGGAVVALVGPAESGKSTLLEILAGHLLPTEGEVLLDGAPVAGPGRRSVVIRSSPGDVRTQVESAVDAGCSLLLLDEPFAGLSDTARERLQEDLHDIWKETGTTMVLAARLAEDVVPMATRVIVLTAAPGEIVHDVHVNFAERDQPVGALLADPDLAQLAARLRVA